MVSRFEVRRLGGGEQLDLLASERRPALWSCAFQATDSESNRTLGEALLATVRYGTRVLVRSVGESRDSEVEDALLAAAIETSERRGASALFGWQPEASGSEHAARWQSLGFEPSNRRFLVEADASDVVKSCRSQMARVRARVRVPTDVRVVPLREAPLQQIVELKTLAFGGGGRDTAVRVRGDVPGSFEPDLSMAIMTGDRVAGIAFGTKRDEQTLFGEAIAIHPAYRGRWALPLLKGEWFCTAFDLGIQRIQGEIALDNAVSRKVFSRDGFKEVSELCDFVRPLESAAVDEEAGSEATLIVSGAPTEDLEPLLETLRDFGWDNTLGADLGRLTALPARPEWWRRTAGRIVRLPFVLLKGLPDTRQFRVVLANPVKSGRGGAYQTAIERVGAQLRRRSNCQVLELSEPFLYGGSPAALGSISRFLSQPLP